jgi:predicted site-specific integrase-resolvase
MQRLVTPMKLTLGQAAKHTGINKATLSRYLKQGKISAEKQQDGSYRIDPSELDRLQDIRTTDHRVSNPAMPQTETPHETRVLQREIELLREQLRDKDMIIADLREERNEWRKQAQTLLLPRSSEQAQQAPEQPRSWWQRLWS